MRRNHAFFFTLDGLNPLRGRGVEGSACAAVRGGPVPTKVISDMLGVPYDDHEFPFDEVPFKHDRLAYGVYDLPVTW